MKRAVIDTNVFVGAGFNRRSASAELLRSALQGHVLQIWTEETRAETRNVMQRIPPLDWDDFAPVFQSRGAFCGVLDLASVDFVIDPQDRKFAALSLQSGAPLVSSDRDVLDHDDRLNVWTPGAFRSVMAMREEERTAPKKCTPS